MRLGQLSRRLDITISDIAEFLDEQGIEINKHPNSKLDEEIQIKVIDHFAPEGIAEEVVDPTPIEITEETVIPKEETPVESEPTSEALEQEEQDVDEVPDQNDHEEVIEPKAPQTATVQDILAKMEEGIADDEEIDLIKAPKVELQGLKVVGKIDLPEPKVKEEETEEPEEIEEEDPNKIQVVRHDRRNSRKRLTEKEREERRIKNKKAREKRIAEQNRKRKEREKNQIKNKKKEHYLEKIAKEPSAPSKKRTKKRSKKTEEMTQYDQPKTILGKFWRWLNT